MASIILPNNWFPRPYQLPVLRYLDGGGKRAVTVWARRHGKDSTAINHTAKAAHQRVGLYWHMLPTLRQGRKTIWNGIDREGRRIIDQAFPLELRAKTRDDEMMIEFKNGSIWQVVGGDSYDALVGSNPVGVVLSEWSLMDPKAWEFITPILLENGGWAWFIYTPRGKNHGWKTYESAKNNPGWFHEIVDIETAKVLDVQAVLREERANGKPEELIRQEYYCNFNAGNVGSIYENELLSLERNGQITEVPYDPNFPVETAWDLGFRDMTSIWFVQRVGMQIRVIDYFEDNRKKIGDYASILQGKGYGYARHIGPHDLTRGELGTGKMLKEVAAEHGINFEVAPKLRVEDGLNATRAMLHRCWFDKTKCQRGLDALTAYKWDYDEDKEVFSNKPMHDWASHPADALRYYATMPELELTTPDWLKAMMAGNSAALAKGGGHRIGQPVPGPSWSRPGQRPGQPDLFGADQDDPLAEFV